MSNEHPTGNERLRKRQTQHTQGGKRNQLNVENEAHLQQRMITQQEVHRCQSTPKDTILE